MQEIVAARVQLAARRQIARLLSREYLTLTVVGYVLAVPVAYFVMKRWLQSFAYRVDIGFDNFVLAAVAITFIVVVTLGSRIVRSARANPADGGAMKLFLPFLTR